MWIPPSALSPADILVRERGRKCPRCETRYLSLGCSRLNLRPGCAAERWRAACLMPYHARGGFPSQRKSFWKRWERDSKRFRSRPPFFTTARCSYLPVRPGTAMSAFRRRRVRMDTTACAPCSAGHVISLERCAVFPRLIESAQVSDVLVI